MLFGRKTTTMVSPDQALPGRDNPMPHATAHVVLGTPLVPPFPAGIEVLYVGMGCFWGSERVFWSLDGVYTTAAGYMGGHTPNPTYEETCTGLTGHTEAVAIAYDPTKVDLDTLFKAFWENHDPTQLNGQGGDQGTQYRTAIYTTSDAQLAAALDSRDRYQAALGANGFGSITTEIRPADEAGAFFLAEDHHQQYLHKNPGGYCNHGFCQVGYDLEAHGQVAKAELPEL